MPSTFTNSYTNQGLIPVYDHGQKAEIHRIKLGNSATYVKGTVMGQITATGIWRNYLTGSADGSQLPKCFLQFDCTTDGSGNVTIGGGQQGETYPDAPAFFSGDFAAADLTGLDAGGVTAGKILQLWGDLSTGVVRIPG